EVRRGKERGLGVWKELARTRRRNADKVDPRNGTTRLGQRTLKCVVLGPDPRIALWPAASPPHKQAGHMTAPDQCCSCVRKFLPRRRPHMTQSGHRIVTELIGISIQSPKFSGLLDSSPTPYNHFTVLKLF